MTKISPIAFGWINCIGGGGAYALTGWLNGRLVTRYGMVVMMRLGFSIMVLSGLLMMIGKVLFGISSVVIIIPIILFYFGSTFIWPNAFATALVILIASGLAWLVYEGVDRLN